ncbi:SGNH/GDSL hydrolase family protein [Nocardioides sp.]|uniref:SGNH/GDSL hydrolase family protein n=1 Tax=Nocardioides sp. TaxID=35761 RepID=UPI003D0FA128
MSRRITLGLAVWLGTVVAFTIGGRVALHRQARVARAAIGHGWGDVAPSADKTYKAGYGDPISLLLLGDSIAAGLGAEKAKHTLGAQLSSRLATKTHRSVRLLTAARVGSETSMVLGQVHGLPEGFVADVAVVIVGGNDVTHRVRVSDSVRHLREVVEELLARGIPVVVGTCPDLGALRPVPQPLRSLGRRASRRLASAQREAVTRLGGRAVSLSDVVGPFFIAQPDQMFSLDQFHPSGAGYRRTAKALLPSVLAALGAQDAVPFGHHEPAR